MTADEVRQIIREELQRNYSSGAPAVPPHTHNGIDNLQLPATSIIGDAVTGDVVTQIVAGSNITVSPGTGVGVVTVSSSGGGGGTPGGSDTQVQFNDASTFGGDSAFTWTKASNILTLDDGSGGDFSGGVIVTGGTSDISFITNGKSSADVISGSLFINTGNASGTGSASGGYVSIRAGNGTANDASGGFVEIVSGEASGSGLRSSIFIVSSGGADSPFNITPLFEGSVYIKAANSGTLAAGGIELHSAAGAGTYAAEASIYLYPGDDVGNWGDIVLDPGKDGDNNQTGDVFIDGSSNLLMGLPDSGRGNNPRCIIFQNMGGTGSPTNPSNGGVLYVEGGELKYRGSSGTITTIAPA
jgi:hypothetical protein